MIVRSRAPLRLGLAGGGTDVSPYCEKYGGRVINATIDRYAWCTLKEPTKDVITFRSLDLSQTLSLGVNDRSFLTDFTGELLLHKAVYSTMMQEFNGNKMLPLTVTTYCESPVGSGLGSSSTVVVALIKAFDELFGLSLTKHDIAKLAIRIERVYCKLQGGKQDQYAATFGGVNFLEFSENHHVDVIPLKLKNWVINELEARIVLYFCGVSRQSANIISQQSENLKHGFEDALKAMHSLRENAVQVKENLIEGNILEFAKCINANWESKKNSAHSVSNAMIDEVMATALSEGAVAGKVSGAGGGGFMWFVVDPDKKLHLKSILRSFGGEVSDCHLTFEGAESWRLP